jgi:hypothetical protein
MGGFVTNRGNIIPFPPRGRLATLPPHRIIAVGRNSELARDVFSRTASQHNLPGSSHSQATREAVRSSGMTPDAAPGGTRSIPPLVASASPAQPYFPGEVEVRMVDIEVIYMLLAGFLSVAVMTVVML